MKRLLVLIAALATMLAVVALPAAAGPPVVEFEFEDSFGPDPFIPFCGFDVMIETDVSVKHVHQEIGGDRTKHQTWVSGEDRVYRADDPSKMVSGTFNVSDMQISPTGQEEGVVKIHGLHWHLQAPGYGTVFLEAGQITLDFTQEGDPFVGFSGRSDWATGSFDALCEALS